MTEAAAKQIDKGNRVVELSRADLPLSCPVPNQEVWNLHPRVYLPIEKTGEAVCPYCGTHYVLQK
jgi:uncharacterized Zn-finger protein